MNFPYEFSYKRYLFWRKKTVIGHKIDVSQDRVLLYLEDGSVLGIKKWSKCHMYLGVDWVLAKKKAMEAQTGQSIPLAVGK